MSSVIVIRDLTVRRLQRTVLHDVSLSAEAGSIVLITGPSGSGKSTLAGVISGLCSDGSRGQAIGHVRIAGLDPLKRRCGTMASVVGAVFQDPASQLFGLTVESEVGAALRGAGLTQDEAVQRVEAALRCMDIEHLRMRQPWQLSSGEQQRVALAAVLAHHPPVLVLDEPTSHLDDDSCRRLSAIISDLATQGTTVLVVEHRWDRLEVQPDAVYALAAGRLHPVENGLAGLPDPLPPAAGLAQSCPTPDGLPLLRLAGVGIRAGDAALVEQADIAVLPGDRVAVVGPNGCGKSSLARVMAGLVRPDSGREVRRGRVMLVHANLSAQLIEDSVAAEIGDPAMVERAGLGHLAARPGTSTSRGEQMRIVVAAALAVRPDTLILDEPAIGQDRESLAHMLALTEEALGRHGARIVVTQDERLARVCADKVYRLADVGLCRACGPATVPERTLHAA